MSIFCIVLGISVPNLVNSSKLGITHLILGLLLFIYFFWEELFIFLISEIQEMKMFNCVWKKNWYSFGENWEMKSCHIRVEIIGLKRKWGMISCNKLSLNAFILKYLRINNQNYIFFYFKYPSIQGWIQNRKRASFSHVIMTEAWNRLRSSLYILKIRVTILYLPEIC